MIQKDITLSSPPHIRSNENTGRIMWLVCLALLPAALGGIYFFGIKTLPLFLSAIAGAVASEAAIAALRGRAVTVSDGSAFLTGFLIALNMPPDIPVWLPFLGSVFAVGVVKQSFGGLGCNIFNPALAGRVFLVLSYTGPMTAGWIPPRGGALSAVTGATPLTAWAEGGAAEAQMLFSGASLADLFTGRVGGCIGETSVLLLLTGAIFLLARRYITWHIPFTFLAGLGILSWALRGPGDEIFFSGSALFHIFSGGAVLGAFFMATDMVTSPITPKGRIIFGAGCGILTALIRFYAGYPEGVSFAILLMNSAVPIIDRHTKPRIYGTRTRNK